MYKINIMRCLQMKPKLVRVIHNLHCLQKSQCFTSRFGLWVKVWSLAHADCPVPRTDLRTAIEVNGSGMIGTPVVPNSNIIFSPLHTDLEIVVLMDQSTQVRHYLVGLLLAELIDLLDLIEDTVERFPTSHRVCPNNRM